MSYEAFARSLQNKLSSLSLTEDQNGADGRERGNSSVTGACDLGNDGQALAVSSSVTALTSVKHPTPDDGSLEDDQGFHSPQSPSNELATPKLSLFARNGEESGCISSVSSVLTEQDNLMDDEEEELIDSELGLRINNFGCGVGENGTGEINLLNFFNGVNLCCDGGFLAKENAEVKNIEVERHDLDEGRSIKIENSCEVVDIRRTLAQTIGACVTFNRDHNNIEQFNSKSVTENKMGISESEVTYCNDNGILDEEEQMNGEVPIDISESITSSYAVQKSSNLYLDLPVPKQERVDVPSDDEKPVRIRRSSSLKTCKTPPGTPGHKKEVRFADALGLDLVDVKTVFLDDIPAVPISAFKDLEKGAYSDDDCPFGNLNNNNPNHSNYMNFESTNKTTTLVPVFSQPGSLPDFFDRLRKQCVCLESAVVSGRSSLRLVIRVLNLDFNKHVKVRFTRDNWITFKELQAEYVPNSNDVFSDKFYVVIEPENMEVGDRISFAISYRTMNKDFWDNNGGQNYIFHCFLDHQSTPFDGDSWIHFQ